VGITASGAAAQTRYTQDEALRLAFPAPIAVERRTAFLDEAQLEKVRRLAGPNVRVDQRVLTYYLGRTDGRPIGVAYFDAHRVRTLNEVLMVVIDTLGTVTDVQVVAFAEPPEYRASDAWLAQLEGKRLTGALSLKGDVVNMTGATLTSQAVVGAVRRLLAYHAVVQPFRGEGR
jgi:Na+-translocating ferredoxin:NAD+ oxidoreductase RnfG subunit